MQFSGGRTDIKKQMRKAIHSKNKVEMAAVLTPEPLEMFNTLMKENRAKRRLAFFQFESHSVIKF
jgi:Spy/CpxP family protein refolding chaperone